MSSFLNDDSSLAAASSSPLSLSLSLMEEQFGVEHLDINDNHHHHHHLVAVDDQHDVAGDDNDVDHYDITPLPFHPNDENGDVDDHHAGINNYNDNVDDDDDNNDSTLKRFMLHQRQIMNATSMPIVNKNDDDEEVNSVMDRNLKIEDMRQRVEAQLKALTQGADFTALRQQVAELRRGNDTNNKNYHATEYAPVVAPSILGTTTTTTKTTTTTPPPLTQTTPRAVKTNNKYNKMMTATNASISNASRIRVAHGKGDGIATASRRFGQGHANVDYDDGEVEVVGVIDSFGKSMHFANPIKSNTKSSKKASVDISAAAAAVTTKASTNSVTTTPGMTKYVERQAVVDPYGDSGTYTGELWVQKPHGLGEMKYSDGRVYVGGWKNGKWHGKGERLLPVAVVSLGVNSVTQILLPGCAGAYMLT
jgi:hypothetical protein